MAGSKRRLSECLRLLAPLAALWLAGCGTLGYYWQAARGEYALLAARQPIPQVVANPATPPAVRTKLRLALAARRYACTHLDLPCNGSYTSYSDLHRQDVVWNVFATPALSMKPVENCFPIAGCVAYRGYFHRDAALARARALKARGDDVYVAGVAAFSTLGHFDDPVLSTMLRWNDDELVGTVFHELTHQKLYVAGDTPFDESLAMFVQHRALAQWLRDHGRQPSAHESAADRALGDALTRDVLATRRALVRLYAQPLPDAMLRARKADRLAHLELQVRGLLRQAHGQWPGVERWLAGGLNNAKLLPFGLYDRFIPGFAALYRQATRGVHGQRARWRAFFTAARRLAAESRSARHAALTALARKARAGGAGQGDGGAAAAHPAAGAA